MSQFISTKMNFLDAEERYRNLTGQVESGQLSEEAFKDKLDQMQVTGADGAWWRIRPQDGAWLRWDGSVWIASDPTLASNPPTPPKRKRRWWLACGLTLLLSCVCLAAVAGGGYLALRAGNLSAMQLATQFAGEANIHVANLDDESLLIIMGELDVADANAHSDRFQLESLDMGSFASLTAGRYHLKFESADNESLNLDCTLRLVNGDEIQFVAVPEGLAVSREGDDVQDPAELSVLSSSLCRQ